MITFKLNGQPLKVPSSWEEVTFAQYIQMFDLKDDVIQVVSIFTGLDTETLRKSTVIGLDRLLESLSFINKAPVFPTYVDQVGPYNIPSNAKGQFNIQYESLGQFEDARAVMNKLNGQLIDHTKAYSRYVAIYLQKIKDGEYDPLKVPVMEEELMNYPAYQIITLGSFFFVKLKTSLNGIPKTSRPTPRSRKKSPRVLKPSKGSSARTRK